MVAFKKPHSILLDFSGDKSCIKYSLLIDLGFPEALSTIFILPSSVVLIGIMECFGY